MKSLLKFLLLFFLLSSFPRLVSAKNRSEDKVNVLLITGGHGFKESDFFKMMDAIPGITYDRAHHPEAHAMLKADKIEKYDVILLYDMPKEIAKEAQQDFIRMLEKGKGLIALHHAFCSYDFWPEYTRIIGGRYHHFPWKKDGIEQPVSFYKHDVTFNIKVLDPNHPVTQGVSDFTIIDETYGGTEILPNVHPLLGTDEPSSSPFVCWTNQYANSKVVTLLLGHDNKSWDNPAFFKILSQAILWTADQ